jgi:hypothetical protein
VQSGEKILAQKEPLIRRLCSANNWHDKIGSKKSLKKVFFLDHFVTLSGEIRSIISETNIKNSKLLIRVRLHSARSLVFTAEDRA